MNKLSKALKAFRIILSKPYLLNLILDEEEVKRKYVQKRYGLPDGLPSVSLMDMFPALNEIVSPYSFLEGSSLPTDLALLLGLAKKINCKDYFEIGTWRGESVAMMSAYSENCITLNIPDEEMRKNGLNEDYISLHRFFSKDLKNVQHVQANSLTFDFARLNKKFDLIFVDGDHHSETIKSDTENVFTLLKNENSVIVWHDYGIGTETVRWNVLAGILDGCLEEKRKHLYHVSNTLCAIYCTSPLIASPLKANQKPDKYFSVAVQAHKL